MSRPATAGESPSIASPTSVTSRAPLLPAPLQPYPGAQTTLGESDGPSTVHAPPTAAGEKPFDSRASPATTQSTPARGLGVHSILNPSADNTPVSAYDAASQQRFPPPTASPRGRKRADPASPSRQTAHPATLSAPRRVLTPKSPALRAASMGSQRLPSIQTASGLTSHSLSGAEPRVYTAEPGSADIPTLPPLSAAHRAHAPHPSLEGPQYPAPGQTSGPGSFPAMQGPLQSRDAVYSRPSPNPSVQTSPRFHYGATPSGQSALPGYPSQLAQRGYRHEPVPRAAPENYHSGPSSYQMTLETEQGPMIVPVELDLLQASKVADEKRKRNAGASARFRARRKEKEKEASHTISSMQQDMRDLRAERDFYREERNFMREFAARHVGRAQIPARPPTPVRRANPMSAIARSETPSQEDDEEARPRSDSAPAAQRRRAGEYHPAYSPPQPEPPLHYPSGYQQPLGLPLPLPHASGPYASPRSLPPGPPAPVPPGSRAQSAYDPFRRDPFDRVWESGR